MPEPICECGKSNWSWPNYSYVKGECIITCLECGARREVSKPKSVKKYLNNKRWRRRR